MTAPRTPEGACAVCGRGGYPRFGTECAEWCERVAEALVVPLYPCGTEAAYKRHLYNSEPTCAPCRAGHAAYEGQQRAARALAATGERAAEGGSRAVGVAAAPVRGGE